MNLVTERLELLLLTPKQLRMWCENINELEKSLNCSYDAEPMDGFFGNIVKQQIEVCEKDFENLLYHSFWLIIRKKDRIVVGSCCFKNTPNVCGEVEIGYGLGNNHEHNGYMTECVRHISSWALTENKANFVIAETEPNNKPSERVLERCNFKYYKTVEENKWWRL